MAGLPGTGLGGVFYILLILWMILRKSAKPDIYAKWRRLIPLGSMAIAIIMVLWGEMWIIGKTVGGLPTFADIVSSGIPTSGVLAIALALVPLLTLAALLMALHLARLMIPRDRVRSP